MATMESVFDEASFLNIAIAIAESLRSSFPEINCLKSQQVAAITNFLLRRDVFAVLPTGYGKSLIFQIIPNICSRMAACGFNYPSKPILLVISPLVSLIKSHIQELNDHGISCVWLSDDDANENAILNGEFSIVFTSPEAIIKNKKWREMLRGKIYQKNLFGIVTDEVHVIPKWGYTNAKEQASAFRQCFSKLGELRSLVPNNTPILALTATASSQTIASVTKSLSLRPNMKKIYVSPNRPNIYLFNKKISKDMVEGFSWLINDIKENNINTEKTLIYCKTQKDCGKLFRIFKLELGTSAYCSSTAEHQSENMVIGMYHHNTLLHHQQRIMETFFKAGGICRVVFATTALGMGVNIPDIRRLVHFGPPRSIEDLVQEIGRAGRDSCPSKALLLYTGTHLKKCDTNVVEYAKSTTKCLRQILLQSFDTPCDNVEDTELHECCTICHHNCKCDGESCALPTFDISVQHMSQEKNMNTNQRKVPKDKKHLLNELLTDYRNELASKYSLNFLPSQCSTGFTEALVRAVLQHCKFIFSLDDVYNLTPVHKHDHAVNILLMIQDVFEDIEVPYDRIPVNYDVDTFVDLEYGGKYLSEDSDSAREECSGSTSSLSGIIEMSSS